MLKAVGFIVLWACLAVASEAINPKEVENALSNGGVLIDIRTPIEWEATGVIEDSRLLSFFDEKGQKLLWRFIKSLSSNNIKKNTFIILVCNSGFRSKKAIADLRTQGYENVFYVNGGILAWRQSKLPLIQYQKQEE